MPQHVRRHPIRPGRQVRRRRRGQSCAQPVVADGPPGPIDAGPLGWEQRGSVPGVIIAELAPHVLDIPAQRAARVIEQGHHPLPRSRASRPFTEADMQLAERAQLPPHVVQGEVPGLVDAQPDIGHQPGRGVVAGRGRELAAGRQLLRPPGEQRLDLALQGRDAQLGVFAAARPVHLIDRALYYPPGHRVQLGFVPQLDELEVHAQRGGLRQPGALRRAAQYPAEVRVGVVRFHFPQRPAEPSPQLVQVTQLAADRAVGQPCGRAGQHHFGQHVSLEPLQFLSRGGRTVRSQVRDRCDSQLTPLAFSSMGDSSALMRPFQDSRSNFNTPSLAKRTGRCPFWRASRSAERSNASDVVLFPGSSRELEGPQRKLGGPAQRFSHVRPGDADGLGAAD